MNRFAMPERSQKGNRKEQNAMDSAPVLIPPIRPGHVLVVDDDASSRRFLRGLLKSKGHRITEARDGEDALAAIRKEPPDVVLLDVVMPRMDGFEVCRRIKGDPATALTHVLMITGLTNREHLLKGIKCGAEDFLTKPVEPDEVLLRVRNAVMAKQMMDELQQRSREDERENTLLNRLHSLSGSDAGMALSLLALGAEMVAWRVSLGQLDNSERDRLYAIYERLSAVLARSGAPPA